VQASLNRAAALLAAAEYASAQRISTLEARLSTFVGSSMETRLSELEHHLHSRVTSGMQDRLNSVESGVQQQLHIKLQKRLQTAERAYAAPYYALAGIMLTLCLGSYAKLASGKERKLL
jgi:hypothetical protein